MTEEQATKKKGLGPLAWIAIGCGGLIIIAFVLMSAGVWFAGKKIKEVAEDFEENPAKSAAELFVRASPDLELVESDEDEGTITVRLKETGEVATFDYSEIEEGKLSFESSEGKMTFDGSGDEEGAIFTMETDEGTARLGAGEIETWVPEYPNAEEIQIGFTEDVGESSSGTFGFATTDSVEEVLAFYTAELEAAGFTVQENTSTQNGEIQTAFLTAANEATDRNVQVTITPSGETTQVGVSYSAGE